MRNLLIGDLHFGTKSNSSQWLEIQIKFFNEQIIKLVETEYFDRVIFLGDLTDIRWSINQQVGCELKKAVRKLSKALKQTNPNGKIIFIAGNHDYFSPLEEFVEYNSYELIFGKEFTMIHDNIIFVNKQPYYDEENDGALYLPWFFTENSENFASVLYDYKNPLAIYCHTDLSGWDAGRITALRKTIVYSGHIHFGWEDHENNFYNLAAAMSFNFNDINQKRYLYIIENNKIVDKVENVITPQFKRLYDEQIFNELNEEYFENAFVQFMINKQNINTARYIERLKELKNLYSEKYFLSIKLYDNMVDVSNIEFAPIETNINEYIHNNVPNHLQDKYNIVKNLINNEEL